MAVIMNSFLQPATTSLPFLLEDKYIRGGMRCVADDVARDAIPRGARLEGMLVWCTSPGKLYQVAADLTTWKEASLGGGGRYTFENPLVSATNAEGITVVTLGASNRIPESPGAGYSLISGPNNTLIWVDLSGSADKGTRITKEYEALSYLNPGMDLQFDLEMARTSMLLEVTLNAYDIQIECHTSAERNDKNPYRFRSSTNFMSDEGVTEEDDKFVKHRRYAFVSNTDGTRYQYWVIRNIGVTAAKPKLTVTYLVME
ncbi:hypothetical protein fHeYen902_043c [Yersinia phage fHe-Yen9-02]|nr:hypothetical protein fHeYen902_043c [Yersinia phage fHe-Yen9-02]